MEKRLTVVADGVYYGREDAGYRMLRQRDLLNTSFNVPGFFHSGI
jgi:hypothetical protein